MIAFFPEPYPDELLYSVFARFYAQTGYMRYVFVAEDLYRNKQTKPNIEFLNALTDDAAAWLVSSCSMEEIVEKHTMYPYFARFLPKERRGMAFDALVNMDESYRNHLRLPKGVGCKKRMLRYCPECARSDKLHYGETYWHRQHQLIGVDVCVEHGCYLLNSEVPIISIGSPALHTAEESVDDAVCSIGEPSELQLRLAAYMVEVFNADVDLESDIAIGQFLHSALEQTLYLSVRGKKRYMERLWTDFSAFYVELPDTPIKELWQLQKLFNGKRIGFWEVCMVAMFLGVSASDSVNAQLPSVDRTAEFDATVKRLRMEGMKYPQIAEAMGASYDYVKLIGNRK